MQSNRPGIRPNKWLGPVGWKDYLGPAEPQPRVGCTEESILCGHLRLRPLPVSPRDQPRWRSSETNAGGCDDRLARQFAAAPRGIHHAGRVRQESGTVAEEPYQQRGDGIERSGARRTGLTARPAVVWQLRPRAHRTIPRQWRHLSHVSMQSVASRRTGYQVLHGLSL